MNPELLEVRATYEPVGKPPTVYAPAALVWAVFTAKLADPAEAENTSTVMLAAEPAATVMVPLMDPPPGRLKVTVLVLPSVPGTGARGVKPRDCHRQSAGEAWPNMVRLHD